MAQNEGAAVDQMGGGSFSRLLFSDIEVDDTVGLHHHQNNNSVAGAANPFAFSIDKKTPKMLCFGALSSSSTPHNPTTTTTDRNTNSSSSSTPNIKRNTGHCDYYQPPGCTTAPPVRSAGRTNKKIRTQNTPPPTHAKVRKEKLGERIAALQQMVSPYGKTDTASVLHEAMGYIKFLQEQVQVLCSPYLQRLPPTPNEGEERKKVLRRRGLCLVPVECTLHVAESNGADMWSPAHQNSTS